jgi:hypothetical protein
MISSRNTKIRAVANARYYYGERGVLVFRNDDSLEEIYKDFVKQANDSWAAIAGKHDDRTMAMIWALMVLDKEIVDDYFTVEEYDDCGKPAILAPHDDMQTFSNPTSIYTNEQVDKIENSNLSPIAFGSVGHSIEEIDGLLNDGWVFLGGSQNQNPNQNWGEDQWQSYERLDANKYF